MTDASTIAGAEAATAAGSDPYLVEIVAPIESVTRDATVAEIRGPVPPSRNTLAGMSDALDGEIQTAIDAARRFARRYALIFG